MTDPTATPPRPDLRTLAAEAVDGVLDANGWMQGDPFPVPEDLVDAVLAAVLPEHRRMVLGDAVDDLHRVATNLRATNPDSSVAKGVRYAEARIWAQLTAAPPAGLSPPCRPGTPRRYPRNPPRTSAGCGDCDDVCDERCDAGWLPLADVLDALRDDDNALLAWHLSRNPDTYLDVAGVRYIADYLAERFATTAPEDPNADLR